MECILGFYIFNFLAHYIRFSPIIASNGKLPRSTNRGGNASESMRCWKIAPPTQWGSETCMQQWVIWSEPKRVPYAGMVQPNHVGLLYRGWSRAVSQLFVASSPRACQTMNSLRLPTSFTLLLNLVKLHLHSGAPLWVTICLLDQSLPLKGQVMPQILTRLSEPCQELVNLRSKSRQDLADQQQFTRDYNVVVQLVRFSPGMTSLRLAHLWSVAGSRISFTKFEEYRHISLISHWKTLAIPVIPTRE
jgi:hypothetical protein